MAFKKTFVVSSEAVNDYGFRIITAGIDLTQANKNCPAFFNHETWDIPLGHWENLRVENNELLADLVIDGANDSEKEYIRKIQNGDIKGASIGADPIAWDEDVNLLLPGQTAPTLVKCDLFEISLTPLPGNKSALALKSKNGLITLSAENKSNLIPSLKIEPDMKSIALKLGLPESATEAEILNKIGALQLSATSGETLRQQLVDANAEELEGDAKEIFVELSKTDPAKAMKFLKLNKNTAAAEGADDTAGASKIKKDVKVSDLVQKGKAQLSKQPGEPEETKTFDYLQKKNPVELSRIRKEEPEEYKRLAADYAAGVRYTGK